MIELVSGCAGLIVGTDPVTGAVLDAGPLRAVAKYGAGTDNIDLDAAAARGIPVTTTGNANAASVAELTIGLVFCVARGIPAMDRAIRAGGWERRAGLEVADRTLGIIGYGAIGQQVSQRARALSMHVIAHDPFIEEAHVPLQSLDDLLAEADVVSVHVPLVAATRGLIGAEQIARMRPGAALIHVARGGVVDEDALADALEDGRLGGAALDCFVQEPLPAGHRLTRIDNVILTPHCGAATVNAAVRAGTRAVESLAEQLAAVNPSAGPR